MKGIVVLMGLMIMATASFGADLNQKVTTPSGIVLYLPVQWQQIPKDILTAQFEEAFRQNPDLRKQMYEDGFQAPAEQWFSYPYLLVQSVHTGRIFETAFKKVPKLDEVFDAKVQETAQSLSATVDAVTGKAVYDSNQRILWTSAKANYLGIGNIKMLAGGHLSEDGIVQIYCYAREEDFSRYENLFHQIISRVDLPPGIRYVPRITDKMSPVINSINWDKALSKGIVGAVVGGIAGLILALMRRKKKSRPED